MASTTELATQWLQWDRNPKTRSEIESLIEAKNDAKLEQLLRTRLEFGTAGLRAAMGAGNSRMNDVTVIQAAQGLAAYLKAVNPSSSTISIAIGHDARHNSERFAELSVNVFLAAGFQVYAFRQIVPTPFVPFAVRHFQCHAGVMVTASHNPKEDNGYKVYWKNGAQIISPIDSGIAAAIEAHLEPQPSSWERLPSLTPVESFDTIFQHYFASLEPLCHHREINVASSVKFTYTAMHGVGTQFTTESLRRFGVEGNSLVYVAEQVQPDPDFPTVAFPNPEEGKSALNLSFATADRNGSRVILANDPDADRLAVAEKQRDGTWRVFTGNHIGALLGWWNLFLHKSANNGSVENVAMLSSAVSSMILRSIAQKEGFLFEETLTGFKWMGSRSEQLMSSTTDQKKIVLFAFEEAIGFMCGTRVFDKDGVTAAAVLAECANYLDAKENGKLLSEKLEDIYTEYGRHTSYNSYVVSRDPVKSKAMFDTMRHLEQGGYPTVVAGAKVLHIRDLTVGFDSREETKKPVLPTSAVSPMITFYFDNNVTLTIRGSGTEPKLKWYSELISTEGGQTDQLLTAFVDQAVKELMRPQEFGFAARPT